MSSLVLQKVSIHFEMQSQENSCELNFFNTSVEPQD